MIKRTFYYVVVVKSRCCELIMEDIENGKIDVGCFDWDDEKQAVKDANYLIKNSYDDCVIVKEVAQYETLDDAKYYNNLMQQDFYYYGVVKNKKLIKFPTNEYEIIFN